MRVRVSIFALAAALLIGSSVAAFADSRYTEPMIYIPAGSFLMGSSEVGDDAKYFGPDEKPQHSVYLAAYYISKFAVTRGQYRKFMDAGGYSDKSYWSSDGWDWKVAKKRTEPDYWTAEQDWKHGAFKQKSDYPVVGVSYYEAEAFCNWAGGHLPTEAQWEKAARGTDGRLFPWGKEWDKMKCNTRDDGLFRTKPVGSYPTGASSYGCMDMAGNVWQWCKDWYGSGYYSQTPSEGWKDPTGPASGDARVLRGGSWGSDDKFCRCASRFNHSAISTSHSCGFRLAR